MGRLAVETDRVLFQPVFLDAGIALFQGPVDQLLPLSPVVEERHRHAAGRLHQVDLDIEELPGTGDRVEQGKQPVPVGIVPVDDPGPAIETQDQGLALERGEHQGHAGVFLDVRGGLVPAPGHIEPQHPVAAQDPQGIHALRGDVDPAVFGGGADEEDLLVFDELLQLVGDTGISLAHPGTSYRLGRYGQYLLGLANCQVNTITVQL